MALVNKISAAPVTVYYFEFLTETGKTFRIVTDKPLFEGKLPLTRFIDAAELPKAFVSTTNWGEMSNA